MNNALEAFFPAGVAVSSGSRALGFPLSPSFLGPFFGGTQLVFAPLRVRSTVPLTPAPDLVATSREKIREWALSHAWRRLTLSGWTLFPSETLPERNLRALHSYMSSTGLTGRPEEASLSPCRPVIAVQQSRDLISICN